VRDRAICLAVAVVGWLDAFVAPGSEELLAQAIRAELARRGRQEEGEGQDESLSTCYAHQSRLGKTSGAPVRKGEVIGYVGNTGHSFGNHLHFETWVRGQPVDPMGFL